MGDFDACRFDFRIDAKHGLTPSKRKRAERRAAQGYNTLFKCKVCGVLFDNRPELMAHKILHSEYKCPVCNETVAGKGKLRDHMSSVHGIGKVKASEISRGLSTTAAIQAAADHAANSVLRDFKDSHHLLGRAGSPGDGRRDVMLSMTPPDEALTSASHMEDPIGHMPPGSGYMYPPPHGLPMTSHSGPRLIRPKPLPAHAQGLFPPPGAYGGEEGAVELEPGEIRRNDNVCGVMRDGKVTALPLDRDQDKFRGELSRESREEAMRAQRKRRAISLEAEIIKRRRNLQQRAIEEAHRAQRERDAKRVLADKLKGDLAHRGDPRMTSSPDIDAKSLCHSKSAFSPYEQLERSPRHVPPPAHSKEASPAPPPLLGGNDVTRGMSLPVSTPEAHAHASDVPAISGGAAKRKNTKPSGLQSIMDRLWKNRTDSEMTSCGPQMTSQSPPGSASPLNLSTHTPPPAAPRRDVITDDMPLDLSIGGARQQPTVSRSPVKDTSSPEGGSRVDRRKGVPVHLTNHEEAHTDVTSQHSCDRCDFQTSHQGSLHLHMRDQHDQDVYRTDDGATLYAREPEVLDMEGWHYIVTDDPAVRQRRVSPTHFKPVINNNYIDRRASPGHADDVSRDNQPELLDYMGLVPVSNGRSPVARLTNQGESKNPAGLPFYAAVSSSTVDLGSQVATQAFSHSGRGPPEFFTSVFKLRNLRSTLHRPDISDAVYDDEPIEAKFHCCKVCSKLFDRADRMWEHRLTEHGDAGLSCDFCRFKAEDRAELLTHILKHDPEKEGFGLNSRLKGGQASLTCAHCDITCSSREQLEIHLRSHGDNCPTKFACPYTGCGLQLNTRGALKTHVKKVHLRHEAKVVCTMPGCRKRCDGEEELQRHLLSHLGALQDGLGVYGPPGAPPGGEQRPEKIYRCDHKDCDKVFKESKHLRIHRFQHSDQKPLMCQLCDYSCRQRNSMNWHMTSKHQYRKTLSAEGRTIYVPDL